MSPISEKDTQYERTVSAASQKSTSAEQSKQAPSKGNEDYDEYDEDEFEDVSLSLLMV